MQFPLLAAIDWVRLAILLIFIVGPLISQIFKVADQARKAPRPKPQPDLPPQPRERNPMQRLEPAVPAAKLESEIEEFLTRAGRPRQKPPAKQTDRSHQPGRAAASRPRGGLVMAEPVDPMPTESVAEHVQRHIGSHPVSSESKQLGRTIANEIDGMESQIHQVFDHQLGSLKKTATTSSVDQNDVDERGTDSHVWDGVSVRSERDAASVVERSANIRRMLSQPENVQQAIILSEILKRPEY